LREGQSDIESEGIRRALERANNADLKIYLCDQGSWSPDEKDLKRILDDQTFLVVNKMDLGDIGDATEMLGHLIYPISVRTGDGIGNLLSALEASVSEQFEASESPALTRERHRNALEECQEFLQSSLSVVESEFRAEELRLGVRALARITGRVDVEDLLDVIFNEFCIGK
ncbi:MAG: tRNA uridine-5-carboxymethylaminomethyl(34) synthesis GTPase MnmE, partial [Rhodospirillales bacterium]|nr:tRNA uridine-5-carboxymethylaminomethyl(34) synthesis GTPase MnmE [Rhodospirillales bacterium]